MESSSLRIFSCRNWHLEHHQVAGLHRACPSAALDKGYYIHFTVNNSNKTEMKVNTYLKRIVENFNCLCVF